MTLVASAQFTIVDTNDSVSTSSTAPPNPVAGVTLWCDTSVSPNQLKKWNGTAWEIVNEVIVGGRNLLKSSDILNAQLSGVTGFSALIASAPNGFFVTGGNNSYDNYVRISNVITGNGVYTISYYLRGSQSVIVRMRITADGVTSSYIPTSSDNTFKKITYTFTVTNYSEGNGNIDFSFQWAFFYLKDIKIEKGNTATDWTPAPEDVQSQIDNITSDNVLDKSEKPGELVRWNDAVAAKAQLNSLATTYGITTENTTYNTAFQALATYLNAGTTWSSGTPSWLASLTTDTTIVGTTYRTKWNDYRVAEEALRSAIAAKAKTALDYIANITSDNILDASEKPTERGRWEDAVAAKAKLNASATLYSITTENTTYNTAFQNLANYLNNGTAWSSGIPSWIADANLATNTTIVGSTYRQKWNDYRVAEEALRSAITTKAKTEIDNIQVGGRNLVKKSSCSQSIAVTNQPNGLSGWGGVISSVGPAFGFAMSGLLTSTDYTISFMAWCESGAAVLRNDLFPDTLPEKAFTLSTTPTIYTWSFNTAAADIASCNLRFFMETYVSAIHVTDIKLERGNKRTDWTPAPEDVDASIESIQVGGVNHCASSKDERIFGALEICKITNFSGGETVMLSFEAMYSGTQALSIAIYNSGTGLTGTQIARINIEQTAYQKFSQQVILPSTLDNLRLVGWLAGTGDGVGKAKKFKVEIGNKVTDWSPSPEDIDYLTDALRDGTEVEDGLLFTKAIFIKNNDATPKVVGGMSGVAADNVATWAGGTYAQAVADAVRSFKSIMETGVLDKKDGSGHRAFGSLAWNILGQLFVRGDIEATSGIIGLLRLIDGSLVGNHIKITDGDLDSLATAIAPRVVNIPYKNQLANLSVANPTVVFESNEVTVESDTTMSARLRMFNNGGDWASIYTSRTPTSCRIDFRIEAINNGVVIATNDYATNFDNESLYTNYWYEGPQLIDLAIPKGTIKFRATVTMSNPGGWAAGDYLICNPILTADNTGLATNMSVAFFLPRFMAAQDGFYCVLDSDAYLYFTPSHGLEAKLGSSVWKITTSGLNYVGAADTPAGLGGASVGGTGIVSNPWGKITDIGKVVKSGSNYTITHNIGDLYYSMILTPYSTNVPYISNRSNNTIVVTCAGGFDFVLIRTK